MKRVEEGRHMDMENQPCSQPSVGEVREGFISNFSGSEVQTSKENIISRKYPHKS